MHYVTYLHFFCVLWYTIKTYFTFLDKNNNNNPTGFVDLRFVLDS